MEGRALIIARASERKGNAMLQSLDPHRAIGIFLWFQLIFYSRSECFLLASIILSIRSQKHFYLQIETFFLCPTGTMDSNDLANEPAILFASTLAFRVLTSCF